MTDALILSLLGVVFSMIGIFGHFKRNEIRRIGRSAQGKIIKTEVDMRGGGPSTFTPFIRFTTDDGTTVTGKPQCHFSSTFSRIGLDVNVLHDPQDANRFIVDDPWQQRFYYIFIALGSIFLAAGVYQLTTSGFRVEQSNSGFNPGCLYAAVEFQVPSVNQVQSIG